MTKIYLAGPMSGIPQFNFPAFFAAAVDLREDGFEVVSPAEIDCKEDGDVALKSATGDPKEAKRSWGDFLSRDVKLLADTGIEGIVFLPRWETSKGVKLEAYVGLLLGFRFWEYREGAGGPAKVLDAKQVLNSIYHDIVRKLHQNSEPV